MTLNKLIDELLNIKNNELYGNGNVEVELVPSDTCHEYGIIDSIDTAEHSEDEYDPFEGEYVAKIIPSVRVNFTKCFE